MGASIRSVLEHRIKTQRRTSLFVSKISLINLIAHTDFTDNQNVMCRVIWGYICTLKIKILKEEHRGVVVISTQLHSTNPELRFCAGSNPACGVLEIRDDEDLWLVLAGNKANAFLQSAIPQNQFIIIIIHIKYNTRNIMIFSITYDTFAKFGG